MESDLAKAGNTASQDADAQSNPLRRFQEKAARGEEVTPEDIIAGMSIPEEQKQLMREHLRMAGRNPEKSLQPMASPASANDPETNSGATPDLKPEAFPPQPARQAEMPVAAAEKPSTATSDSGNSVTEQPGSDASGASPELPDVNIAWGDVKGSLRIPIPRKPGDDRVPQFSSTRPLFVQFGRSVFEVRTGREIAKLPAEFSSDIGLVNSDGTYVVRFNNRSGSTLTTIYVHKVQTPASFTRIDCTRYRSVNSIKLITPKLLVVVGETNSSLRWTIWNIESGQEVASFKIGDDNHDYREGHLSINPAGTKMLVTARFGGGRIYDLMTGQIESQLEPLPTLKDGYAPQGPPEYSPDGKEIAAFVGPAQIAVWSEDGTLIQHETVPGIRSLFDRDGTNLRWLPDNSGWFFGGSQLIDRKTSMIVWELVGDRHTFDRTPASCVLSQNQVLITSGDDEDRELMPVRIPWDKITEKLALIRTNEPVELRAGASVSVFLEVGTLRLAINEQVTAQLKQSVGKLLGNTNLKETPNQPIRLVVRHVEAAEQNRLGAGFLFGGGNAGQKPMDTKIVTTIELQDSKTNSLYWRGQLETTGWLYVRDNQTEQALREAAFAKALEEIGQVVLPTRVFPGEREGLPIRTPAP